MTRDEAEKVVAEKLDVLAESTGDDTFDAAARMIEEAAGLETKR